MEVTSRRSLWQKIKGSFLKEPKAFTTKRDVDWSAIKKFGGLGIFAAVVVVLLLPTPKPEQTTFHEKVDPGATLQPKPTENDPSSDTLAQLQQAQMGNRNVPGSLDYLYQGATGGGGAGGKGQDRNSPMILARGGVDSKTQLPPGSRISVRLLERAVIAGQAMPVIGIVVKDVVHEDSVAIPEGSKLFGEMSFDDSSERAQVGWRSIQFPDGRERQISAMGVSSDGQVGLEGHVHSDALKNTVGQTITRFIGAYAEGSMQKGAMGSSQGGNENGFKNAVADTAKDRADAWAESMKKERKWIELSAGSEFLAVLNQSFLFRDPGATYGR